MEIDHNHQPQTNNSNIERDKVSKIFYLNKKRKFQPEQLGLPLPKHKCLEPMQRFEEKDGFENCTINKYTGTWASDDGSVVESVKDSNSYIIHSAFATSIAKSFEKASTSYDQPSTSYENCGSSFQNDVYSLHSKKVASDKLQESYQFDDQFVEYEDILNNYSEYENKVIEHFSDENLDDISNDEGCPDKFILSSGRWSVHQDTQVGTKKPTIDQELEQYFSSLVLE